MRKRLIILVIALIAPFASYLGWQLTFKYRSGKTNKISCEQAILEAFERKYPNYSVHWVGITEGNQYFVGYSIEYSQPNDERRIRVGGGYEKDGQCVVNENINEQVNSNQFVMNEN